MGWMMHQVLGWALLCAPYQDMKAKFKLKGDALKLGLSIATMIIHLKI
jgi:hypothetical protein